MSKLGRWIFKFYIMKKILFFLFLTITASSLFAQREDYIWLTGYDNNPFDTIFGGTRIDFSTEPPTVSYEFREMDFFLSDASICDAEGNLLFYTDGTTVVDSEHNILENGNGLGPHPYNQEFAIVGMPLSQGTIILNYPGSNDSLYIILHEELTDEPVYDKDASVFNFLYTTVSNNINGVQIVEKNQLIVSDTLSLGSITATRHANGRDWWVLVPKYKSNIYYTIQLGNNGIEDVFQQTIGLDIISDIAGQAAFSPSGEKYSRYGVSKFAEPGQIDIYDFDRCTGMLNNFLHIPIDTTEAGFVDGGFGGIAFSPNSELIYHSRNERVEQYDLLANDIIGSVDTIAFYDEFTDPLAGLPTLFGLAQLAPNGKIYIATSSTTRYMHIIHNPNERGELCNIEQHGFELSTFNKWSVPNHPNYRLKALIGSPCDTIRPLAAFIYDTLSNTVFTDQSARTPTEWQWTFGDGNSSTEQNPNHTYTENGTYEVCLIVSNEAGSDTTCQQVMVVVTSTQDLANAKFKVFPNPTRGQVTVSLPNDKNRSWRLINVLGQEVERGVFRTVEATLDLKRFGSGVYWLEMEGLGSKKILLNTE